MAKIKLYNEDGKFVEDINVSEDMFKGPVRKGLIYYMVRYQLAKRRAGTHFSKSRCDVVGTTKKVYRQKGTGNARHGSMTSHIYVGGGTAFGPKPRDYGYSIPKKAKRKALQSALISKNNEERLILLDNISWNSPKTKNAVQLFSALNCKSALLVVDKDSEVITKSVRNLPHYSVINVEGLNVYDVLNHDHLIIMKSSLNKIYKRIGLDVKE